MKMMTLVHSKAQKMLQRNLSDEKGKENKKLWWRMYFNKYNFHLAFWIATSTVLRILLLYDSQWQKWCNFIFKKKLAAGKTNKYKKNYKCNIRDGKI